MEPQAELPLEEPKETEGEIARRLAEIQRRDSFYKQIARKARQGRYSNSYLLFANEILDMSIKQRYFGEISDRLDKFRDKKHLVLGPRASRKTTFFTGKVLHRAVENPNEPCLIFGETKSNALKILRSIKDICENNEKFINTFGVMGWTGGPTKWTDEELFFLGRKRGTTIKDATFSAGGVDAPLTGGHYKRIWCDDLVSNLNTKNSDQIQIVHDTFLTLRPLLLPGGEFWMDGTFWDPEDLYNTIIEKYLDEFMFMNFGGFGEPGKYDGEAMLPELGLTRDFLLREYNRPGNRARACMWYFGTLVPAEDQPFKDETTWDASGIFNLETLEKADRTKGQFIPPSHLDIAAAVDPASSVAEGACDTGITVCGDDEFTRRWELEHTARRMLPSEVISKLFEIDERWPGLPIGIETTGFYNWIKAGLEMEMEKRKKYLNIVELNGWKEKSKHERIMGCQPRWIAKALILRSDSQDAIAQFHGYPKGKRKDIMDSFAYHEELHTTPLNTDKVGVYYNKNKFPDLTPLERLIWSQRYDPNVIQQQEQSEENRRDAMCRSWE